MKITKIKTFTVGANQDNWVFVKVETDEGISGLGECSVEGREKTVVSAVAETAPYYIGKDPFDTGVHLYKSFRNGYWGGCAVLCGALSAIDTALWDIKGKLLKMPVHKLLGGAFRPKIRAYANRWFFGADTPDKLSALAQKTVSDGFTALKWDPFAKAEWSIKKSVLKNAAAEVCAVRDAVGDNVDILIEGHGRFDTRTAIEIAETLAPYNPMFFEEPVMPENIDALAQVREKSPIAVAAGERMYGKCDFAAVIRKNAADYLQPDVRYCGGITELYHIGVLAQAAFLPVAPHNVHGLVGTAAALQTAAALPNAVIMEYSVEQTASKYGLFETPICFKDGFVEIPDLPGLGIEMDEKQAMKMPFANHSMIEKMFE
ncbi:MAG: galactonate dehydratase [Oscillospiraceae bacterium]|nr:galactonate dehydratase [Oscillospiraceae bacterium]